MPGFASSCLVPYLYAVSHKLQFGGELLFRELKHGAEGIVEDYLDLFGLSNPEQVRRVVRLLGMKSATPTRSRARVNVAIAWPLPLQQKDAVLSPARKPLVVQSPSDIASKRRIDEATKSDTPWHFSFGFAIPTTSSLISAMPPERSESRPEMI